MLKAQLLSLHKYFMQFGGELFSSIPVCCSRVPKPVSSVQIPK